MSIISTPTSNQIVTDPAQGRGLRCAGTWPDEEKEIENSHGVIVTIIHHHNNEDLTVTLIQPGTADKVLRTKTNNEGAWSVTFPSCKPGTAQVTVKNRGYLLDEVQFSVDANQRQPITVRLDGVDASTNPIINLPEDGKNLKVEVKAVSPTRTIRVQINTLPPKEHSSHTPLSLWTFTLNLPGRYAPAGQLLIVADTDFFGVTTTTAFSFDTRDSTPPTISITEPTEDKVIVAEVPLQLVVRGTVRDIQSGYQDGTLTYSFAGQTNVPVVVVNGAWFFDLAVASFGQYELTMTAADNERNTRPRLAVRQFEVVSSYKPKSIDELLGPTAYLNELLRFVRSHLLTQTGAAVNTDVITTAFKQPFGDIAQPNAPASERLISDLLTPVRILRDAKPTDADAADSAGLIARWTFSELAQGAADGLRDRAGRFALAGIYDDDIGSPYVDIVARMWGRPGTNFEGAVVLDGISYAKVYNSVRKLGVDLNLSVLEVGRDNRDFTVSFWIYPNDTGSGTSWRQVLYKGQEGVNRTFGIWLYPDANTVHFRIATTGSWNDGGNSRTQLPTQRWSHLAYVKSGKMLRLYINGILDAEVQLQGDVVANSDPLFIGASPSCASFKGGLAELRLYGFAVSSEDVEYLGRWIGEPV